MQRALSLLATLAALFLWGCGGCDFGSTEENICTQDRCGFWEGRDCGDCSASLNGCDSSTDRGYCSDLGYCVEPSCGNALLEPGEACEHDDSRECAAIDPVAYLSGTAFCSYDCSVWDFSSCTEKNICGNGVVEEAVEEMCELNDTMTCAELDPETYLQGTAICKTDCSGWNISQCIQANVCGNGIVEETVGEVCELGDTDVCRTLDPVAYIAGALSCNADCKSWSTVHCVPAGVCGNGYRETGEVCEQYQTISCVDIDAGLYIGGTAICKEDCSGWGTLDCSLVPSKCGNGIIDDASEECEKGMGIPCVEIDPAQYVYGTAPCNSECSGWSVAPCLGPDTCGNGIFEIGEECEINDTIPCTDIDPTGYLPGNAPCLNDCTGWDPSLCDTAQVCGNGILETGELCDTMPTACKNVDPVKWGFGTARCGDDCAVWETDDCLPPVDPEDMATISGGSFTMGCDQQLQNDCLASEKPEHAVTLSPYTIDRYEVTVAQYLLCIEAGKCTGSMYGTFNGATACNIGSERDPRMPANCISWSGAAAYCAWKNKRLPTEAEWERAARGQSGQTYPWGSAPADCSRAVFDNGGDACGTGATFVIGSFPAGRSMSGLYDMAGNVREWVADRYAYDYYWNSPKNDPPGPASGDMRVARGGSWKSDARSLKTYARYATLPAMTYTDLGFRCAR